MEITTSTGTIAKLFYGNNEQFVIPAYQRRYSWQRKQINQLFNDMDNLSSNDTHFMGSVVCLAEAVKAGINRLELVDGQQRMTTLILILGKIKARYEELGLKRDAERIEDLISCRDYDKVDSKLLLGDLDADDFQKILNMENMEGVKNKNLLDAHNAIKSNLEKFDEDGLHDFKEKLLNRTIIVRLHVSRARDAFKLFEAINNRGLSLSPADIIKNFLLGHASMIDNDTLKRVKKEWTSIIVNLDGQYLDDFFRQYLSGILGRKVTFTSLTDVFKKYYISNVKGSDVLTAYNDASNLSNDDSLKADEHRRVSPIEFVVELRNASEVYANILNRKFEDKKINRALYDLRRIRSFPAYTYILSLMRRNISVQEKLKILWLLQVFMIRRNICAYRTAELDDFFSKLAKKPDERLYEQTLEFLSDHMPSDREFLEKIPTNDFYGRFLDRAKCMLEAIEYDATGKTGEKEIQGGSDVHLEHIIPQTIGTKKSKVYFGDWVAYLGRDAEGLHRNLVSRIGNMTLLAGNKNIIASNNPFDAKKKVYRESEIKITKELAKYSEFKFSDLERRSIDIARKSVKIWRI